MRGQDASNNFRTTPEGAARPMNTSADNAKFLQIQNVVKDFAGY